MAAEIQVTAKAGKDLVPYLRRELRRAMPLLPENQLGDVVVTLVGDKLMAELHAKSHDDPTPTDVLTYELDHTHKGDVTEGQIVICVPEARRRCAEHKMELRKEVLLYALHGLLHLCGMDDRRKSDFDRMHATEDRILTTLGIGPVFHAPALKTTAAAAAPRTKTVKRKVKRS